MARNATIANPNLPSTYKQGCAIRVMAGNPEFYADKETKSLTPFASAVKALTMGEADEIIKTQVVPDHLLALAGKAAAKAAPKTVKVAKGKAAAAHVAETPAATKPKAPKPEPKPAIDPSDRLFAIQARIESVLALQEDQGNSIKALANAVQRNGNLLKQIDERSAATEQQVQAILQIQTSFAEALNAMEAKLPKRRAPKAA